MINRELENELKRELFKSSYHEFFKWAFKVLYPNEKYEDTFHIQYLCELLQEEAERIIRRELKTKDVIINIPPRTSKSLITSVCYLPWVWLTNPYATFICISFDDELSMMNSQLSKDIIKSDEYQELFGDIYQIRKDADSKGYFANDKGGFRLSKTTGANITGHKGCFLPGEKVLIENGKYIDIDVLVNNKLPLSITTFNEKTKEVELKPIIDYSKRNYSGKVYTVFFNNKKIRCTEEHPIYIKTKGWVKAKDLTEGDEILIIENSTKFSKITKIEVEEVSDIEVYNLELQDNNNYVVSTGLVHNCFIIVDDPQNPKTSESEVFRKGTITYYTNSLFNRLTPAQLGVRIIVMQRLHAEDLSGYLLKKSKESYRHICLPAEKSDLINPPHLAVLYSEDGLLDPIRLDRKTLKEFRSTLGSRGYSGQYDQTPSPDEGGIIKKDWFEIVSWMNLTRDAINEPVHFFLDSAYTNKTENDPTGILACFKQNNIIYILDVQIRYLEFPELCNFLIEYVRRLGSHASKVFVEPKASGKSIVQQIRATTMLNIIESPSPDQDKVTRAYSVTPQLEARRVRMVDGMYVEETLKQWAAFPNAAHDEEVDILVMAVKELLQDTNPDFMFL